MDDPHVSDCSDLEMYGGACPGVGKPGRGKFEGRDDAF